MLDESYSAEELAAGMSELTALLLSTPDVEDSLRDVAEITSRMLPGRPMAGVTLTRGGDAMTVAASGAHAMLVDELQYSSGMGPCLEAIATAEPVWVNDILDEHRWSDYAARMLAHGVRSVYSQPLIAGDQSIGALNLYASEPDAFDEQARRAVTVAGQHTGALLAAALNAARQIKLNEQLRAALASRAVIDQATGILMAQQRCGRDRAFDILRTASQHRNIKLAELAAEIVTRVGGTPPEPAHFNEPGRS
jgi:GAF domain-containing protein